jgi:hypothetical protein
LATLRRRFDAVLAGETRSAPLAGRASGAAGHGVVASPGDETGKSGAMPALPPQL